MVLATLLSMQFLPLLQAGGQVVRQAGLRVCVCVCNKMDISILFHNTVFWISIQIGYLEMAANWQHDMWHPGGC